MVDRHIPVSEEELHAYVDGELPQDRRAAVEAWLASHPEDAARVAGWRAQADAIRARYGAVAEEPVPAALAPQRLLQAQRRVSRGLIAAAAAVAFLFGGFAGWFARDAAAIATQAPDSFTAEALAAHRLYIAEVRHPVEVKAGEQHLLPWLSRRVGAPLRAPDLHEFGLKLLGGRLLPGPYGPAALFMYEGPNGERYTLYCSPQRQPRSAFRYNVADRFAAVHWVDGQIGFVVSGPADRERLSRVAQATYEQMEQAGSSPPRTDANQVMSRRGS
jgi:anti-sigma factor RsiW